MRYQGRITDWKDDKGFGFITPNGGGNAVFVHIKDFTNRNRRPVGSELVTYVLKADSRGRPRAASVAFIGEKRSATPGRTGRSNAPVVFASLFVAALVGATIVGKLPLVIAAVYLMASLAAYAAYASDKSAAQSGEQRIRENTLHAFALVGGWPGFDLHKLSGDLTGYWSVKVNGNWRVIFRFDAGEVELVDYLDYH